MSRNNEISLCNSVISWPHSSWSAAPAYKTRPTGQVARRRLSAGCCDHTPQPRSQCHRSTSAPIHALPAPSAWSRAAGVRPLRADPPRGIAKSRSLERRTCRTGPHQRSRRLRSAQPHGALRAALWLEAPRARARLGELRQLSLRRRLPRARLSRSRPPRLGRPPGVACDRLRRAQTHQPLARIRRLRGRRARTVDLS